MDEQLVLLKFLERAAADASAGGLLELREYLDNVPAEHAAVIRREYESLQAASAASSVLPARRRMGRYELRGEVGHGGFGRVYEAYDPQLERRVAVKVLDEVRALSADVRERFGREARAAAGLRHPSLCAVLDSGFEGSSPFLVMQFIDGRPLDRVLLEWAAVSRPAGPVVLPGAAGETAPAAVRRVLELVLRLARGLQVAHDAGVVHRDVKPGNILIDANGAPVLVDFGLAWLDRREPTLTRSGPLGTLAYAAPEVLAGRVKEGVPAIDIWGLGMVLAELSSGRRPFDGPTPAAVDRAIRTAPLPPLPPALGRAFPDLPLVVSTALRKDPRARYASPGALADDIERMLAEQPVAARPPGPIALAAAQVRARPRTTLAVSMVLVLGSLIGLVLVSLRAAVELERSAASTAGLLVDYVREVVRQAVSETDEARTRDRLRSVAGLVGRIEEILADGRRESPELRASLADALEAKTDLHLHLGEQQPAAATSQRALQLRTALLDGSDDPDDRAAFAVAIVKHGDVLSRTDQHAALREYRKALRIDEELWRRQPGLARRASAVAHGHVRISHARYVLGDAIDREDMLRKAIEFLELAESLEPGRPLRIGESIEPRIHLAQIRRYHGDPHGARRWIDGAVARGRRLTEMQPDVPAWWERFANALSLQANLEGDLERRLAGIRAMRAATERALELDPGPERRLPFAVRARCQEAECLRHLGRHAEAIEILSAGWRMLGGEDMPAVEERLQAAVELSALLGVLARDIGDEQRGERAGVHLEQLCARLVQFDGPQQELRGLCILHLVDAVPPRREAALRLAAAVHSAPAETAPSLARALALLLDSVDRREEARPWALRAVEGWPEGHAMRAAPAAILVR